MSESNTPVGAVFDLQRNAIEQTHEAVIRGVEAQQELGETFVDFTPAKQANERSYDAVHSFVDAYFDAVESATPGRHDLLSDFRTAVDEQLDSLEATQIEAIETAEANVREGREDADDFLAVFEAALDDQFEAVLDAHADFEGQVTEIQRQVEGATEEITETAGQQAAANVEAASESIETIDGLGSTYAERLQEQGIESIQALAQANAEAVAEAADSTREQAEGWIESARSQI